MWHKELKSGGKSVSISLCLFFLFLCSLRCLFVRLPPSLPVCLCLSVCVCLALSLCFILSLSLFVSLSLAVSLSLSPHPTFPCLSGIVKWRITSFFFILMTHTVKVWQEDKYYLPQSKGGSGCGILWMLQLWLSHTDWLDNCSEASESPWWVSLTTTEWVYSLNFTHHNTSLPRWNNISNFSFFWSSFRNTFPPFWDCKTLSVLVRNAKFNI